jgi:hypothetical protein
MIPVFCHSFLTMPTSAIHHCCLCPQARAALARRLAQRVLQHWGGAVEARCAAAHLAMRDHEICALTKEVCLACKLASVSLLLCPGLVHCGSHF